MSSSTFIVLPRYKPSSQPPAPAVRPFPSPLGARDTLHETLLPHAAYGFILGLAIILTASYITLDNYQWYRWDASEFRIRGGRERGGRVSFFFYRGALRRGRWVEEGAMACPYCQGDVTQTAEWVTALGYRLFRCRPCRRTFNERTGTPFNHLQVPTDIALLVVLWRLRYKLSTTWPRCS